MRQTKTLLKGISAAQAAGSNQWEPTQGFINSFDAQLDTAVGSATVDVYVSNSGQGVGIKLATLTLTAAAPHDGNTLAREDQGWWFIRAEVSAISGGAVVKQATTCLGE